MSSAEERVLIIGATGDIGSHVVRGLVKKGVNTTVYARNEKKANEMFPEELATGLLKVVVGDYTTMDVYAKTIKGHTRLFILLLGDFKKAARMPELTGEYAKVAFEHGVRQVVHLSSVTGRIAGMGGILGYIHTAGENRLWALADEDSDNRSVVMLRPAFFMTNHFMGDVRNIKLANKIISCGPPSAGCSWIDTRDIADCATAVLTEPIEKHDRLCYEMGAEIVSNEQRAALFTKILGRTITYEQMPPIELHKRMTEHGLAHSLAYDLISYSYNNLGQITTPQLSILLNRPLRTLEEWIRENAHHFS